MINIDIAKNFSSPFCSVEYAKDIIAVNCCVWYKNMFWENKIKLFVSCCVANDRDESGECSNKKFKKLLRKILWGLSKFTLICIASFSSLVNLFLVIFLHFPTNFFLTKGHGVNVRIKFRSLPQRNLSNYFCCSNRMNWWCAFLWNFYDKK